MDRALPLAVAIAVGLVGTVRAAECGIDATWSSEARLLAPVPCRTVAECEPACEEGAARACTHLSVLYLKPLDRHSDRARSTRMAERACELGDSMGCALAENGFARKAVAGEPARSAFLQQRAQTLMHESCRLGVAVDCDNLASSLRRHRQGPDDDACADRFELRGIDLMRKLCDGGHTASCGSYARKLATGIGVANPQQAAAAASRYERLLQSSCDARRTDDCLDLARELTDGGLLSRDAARGTRLLERACDLGASHACSLRAHAATKEFRNSVREAPQVVRWCAAEGAIAGARGAKRRVKPETARTRMGQRGLPSGDLSYAAVPRDAYQRAAGLHSEA